MSVTALPFFSVTVDPVASVPPAMLICAVVAVSDTRWKKGGSPPKSVLTVTAISTPLTEIVATVDDGTGVVAPGVVDPEVDPVPGVNDPPELAGGVVVFGDVFGVEGVP